MFFNTKVKYQKETADGLQFATEEYVINAENPTDCETKLLDEIGHMLIGECEIISMKKVEYFDIVDAIGCTYFNAKVDMIVMQDNGKDARKTVNILVMSDDIKKALSGLEDTLGYTSHEVVGITKTKIVDAFIDGITPAKVSKVWITQNETH